MEHEPGNFCIQPHRSWISSSFPCERHQLRDGEVDVSLFSMCSFLLSLSSLIIKGKSLISRLSLCRPNFPPLGPLGSHLPTLLLYQNDVFPLLLKWWLHRRKETSQCPGMSAAKGLVLLMERNGTWEMFKCGVIL